jgi:hypothetical protein
MKIEEIEALYMTEAEVAEYLNVSTGRVRQLAGKHITKLKGKGNYERASVESYALKRGYKKGGRYPTASR